MKKKLICIVIILLLIGYRSDNLNAGMWIGANVLNNSHYPSDLSGWYNAGSDQNWRARNNCFEVGGGGTGQLRQTVNVEADKRYQLSGYAVSLYKNTEIGSGRGKVNIRASGISSTPYWEGVLSPPTMTTKSSVGIANSSTSSVELYWKGGGSGIYWANVGSLSLNQIVYDPQINIVEETLELNTVLTLATASINIQDLSFADTPTNWYVDWGDGIIDYNPSLNAIVEHTYDIGSGMTQFTATLYGENQAGSMMDTVDINIVPEPCSLLMLSIGFVGVFVRRKTQ